MRTSDIYLRSLGSFIPGRITTEWAVGAGLYDAAEREAHQLVSVAVAGQLSAPEMALQAAELAVKRDNGLSELDLLLYISTWHQGPEGWLPHSYLQRHLVGDAVPAVEIRQGCNGMFTAMQLAVAHLRAEPQRQAALLVASDNYGSPHVDRWKMGRGFIGGDAASAVVLAKQGGFARLLAVCSSTISEAEEMHRGDEPLFPPGITIGRGLDFNSRNAEFRRRSAADPAVALQLLKMQLQTREIVDQTLAEADLTMADITRVAFMNYSRDVVEQVCMATLGLPAQASTWDLGATVGHCGASDQILSLEHLISTSQLVAGDHFLMLGIGPGVMLACAVIEILETPAWDTDLTNSQ